MQLLGADEVRQLVQDRADREPLLRDTLLLGRGGAGAVVRLPLAVAPWDIVELASLVVSIRGGGKVPDYQPGTWTPLCRNPRLAG